MDNFEQLQTESEELGDTLGATGEMTRLFKESMEDLYKTMGQSSKEFGNFNSGFSGAIKGAIDGLVLDGDRLSDVFGALALSMSKVVYDQSLKPVSNFLGTALSNLVNAGVGGVLPFADGAAFSAGRVVPFANGGVVTGPTNFPMRGGMGLMGEAGPEAIMPLTRTADGRLGVAAQGGGRGVHVTMNITTPDVQGFQRSQSQIAAQMARALGRGSRNR